MLILTNNIHNFKRFPNKFHVSFLLVNSIVVQEHILSYCSIDSTNFDFTYVFRFTYLTLLLDNSPFKSHVLHFSALSFNCTRKSNMNE